MNNLKSSHKAILCVVFLIYGMLASAFGQMSKVNLDEFTKEIQKQSQNPDKINLVWWIPSEFWQVSMGRDPLFPKSQLEEFIGLMEDYIVIAVVEGKIGLFAGITYISEAELRNSIEVIDSKGIAYSPLSPEQIKPDTKMFISMLKPLFTTMIGEMGKNMHFFLFPSKDKKGNLIASPTKQGSFSVILVEEAYKWELPLSSLIPPKICPVDGNEMKGAWTYCPWHGEKLPELVVKK